MTMFCRLHRVCGTAVVFYAQSIKHPADPMMGQAFDRMSDMEAWVLGREDAFRYFRYDTTDNTCRAIPLR